MGQINLEGLHFYAYHGHFEAERVVGNDFLVDVSIEADCTPAANSDSLSDALNYQKAYEIIQKEMKIKSHLLEHVCHRILNALKNEFSAIEKVTVKVSKLNPPMGGQIEKVSVALTQ